MTLSVVIITKNEERNIARCLRSVSWADEIVVLDNGSSDSTVKIAREHGACISTSEWRGFGPAKRAGVELAAGPWVLSIDADEEVSPQLAQDIQKAVRDGSEYAGFAFPRRTNFLGRWIRHCGWYPDYQLRLFRKGAGDFDDAIVHERVVLNGPEGRLQGELLHYSDPDLEHYLEKFNRYTTLGARKAFRQGRRTRWFDLTFRPLASLFSHYVTRQGFRDGTEGLILSVLSATAVFVKYAKLRHMTRVSGKDC